MNDYINDEMKIDPSVAGYDPNVSQDDYYKNLLGNDKSTTSS